MSPMRAPTVAGIGGGVGTTTVAPVLGAVDAGVWEPGTPVDVLVCRSVAHQLAAVTRAAATVQPSPVVVVVADCADKTPAVVRDRARMLEPNVAAVVWMPWLAPLREVANPPVFARDAICDPTPPRWALSARARREDLIAAVTTLITATPAQDTPRAPADVDEPRRGVVEDVPPSPPIGGQAVRPPTAVPPPPAAGTDRWVVAPDAPPPSRPGPTGAAPTARLYDTHPRSADGLRRTS